MKPCRLKQLRSWSLRPLVFLGNIQRRFGSWRIPRNLQKIRDLIGKKTDVTITRRKKDEDAGVDIDSSERDDVTSIKSAFIENQNLVTHRETNVVNRPGVRPKKREAEVVEQKGIGAREDIAHLLMKDAKRARTGGLEGMWDSVEEQVVSTVKKHTIEQRNQEKKILEGRKVGGWDANLDSGRVKKMKIKTYEDDYSVDQAENPFQNVQDRRTEDGVAPMMFDNENFGRGGRSKGLKATNGDKNRFQNSKFKKSGKPKPKQKRRGGF